MVRSLSFSFVEKDFFESSGSWHLIAAPPGLTPMSFSPNAMKKVLNRKTPIAVYYWDINLVGDYWNCFGRPRM